MTEQTRNPQDIYELIENDNGEVMVLIFANGKAPQNPSFSLNKRSRSLEIVKNADEHIVLDGLQPETVIRMAELTTLYVCEIKYDEDKDAENEIVYAYAATLKKKEQRSAAKQEQPVQQPKENLSEKARKARESVLKSGKK